MLRWMQLAFDQPSIYRLIESESRLGLNPEAMDGVCELPKTEDIDEQVLGHRKPAEVFNGDSVQTAEHPKGGDGHQAEHW